MRVDPIRKVVLTCTRLITTQLIQIGKMKEVFLLSSTFQTHLVQSIKPSQFFVRPTGIQALPSPVNSTIIKQHVQLCI